MQRIFVALILCLTVVPLWSQEHQRPRHRRGRAGGMAERFSKFAEYPPAVGTEAPDFVLKTLDGEKVRLSDFRGKSYVVLEFGSYT